MDNIAVSYDCWPTNRGFDDNVMCCYSKCDAEYMWFLSDDDNIIPGSLDRIVDDIVSIRADVLYYNFNQPPWSFDNPWVKDKALYYTFNTHDAVAKIVHNAKFSALVIKKGDGKSGSRVSSLVGVDNSGFMHVALALQTVFDAGTLLLSNQFIAYPDSDYMDHVRFVPWTFNNLNNLVHGLCKANDKEEFFPLLVRPHTNPLYSSLSWLAAYHLGRMALSPALERTLIETAARELRGASTGTLLKRAFIKPAILFLVAYAYDKITRGILGRSVARRSEESAE